VSSAATSVAERLPARPLRLDWAELAGAFADLGVLVPIAVALIVSNGLSPTAVLLPAALLYLTAAFVYRLPVPVQPLKAFGAIAIAKGLGADDIAAGALLMGAIFFTLGATGLLDRIARIVPRPLIRGIQLTVGLLFLKIAWDLVSNPPKSFTHQPSSETTMILLGLLVLTLALALRKRSITLAFVAAAVVVMAVSAGGSIGLGPSSLTFPTLHGATFWTALTVLVIPQAPLSFANSCLATADAAKKYFGERAARVRPGRLATTLGMANLFSGAISGMPVCHGAGGMTAHYSFGARKAVAPLTIGGVLLVVALVFGHSLSALLVAFPIPILAGLLSAAGLLHITLLRDLRARMDWLFALAVGIVGFELNNIAYAVGGGLVAWWIVRGLERVRAR
jgi:SulP family sulfate permease